MIEERFLFRLTRSGSLAFLGVSLANLVAISGSLAYMYLRCASDLNGMLPLLLVGPVGRAHLTFSNVSPMPGLKRLATFPV